MSREQDVDRNEKATPYKLEEARKRGSVPRSADALSFGVVATLVIALFALGVPALNALAALLARGLNTSATHAGDIQGAMRLIGAGLHDALQVIARLLFGLIVVVVGLQILQHGPVLSTQPLKPDFSRLNPVMGFKRLLSVKLLYEAFKSVAKLAVLVIVGWLAISVVWRGASRFHVLPTKTFLISLVESAGGLAAKLCAVLALFALVDLLFVRWDYLRSLRMSRREIEDEHKHRDGDPRIKARLRELRHEFLKRTRAVTKVPQADVLITNPTRIAVALRYRHGESPAPQVLAKGAGGLARRMRDIAYRSRVPIVHSPALARALFKEVEQQAYVPERWYPQVARILVWVQAARAARTQGFQSGVQG
jgi:flagellar biosynthesis protein FlhB